MKKSSNAVDFAEQTMPEAELFDGGEQGAVFRSTIGGQPAVIKITDQDPEIEFRAIELLQSIEGQAPPEVRAHLPKILKNKLVDFGGRTYGIIAMEPLVPAQLPTDAFRELMETKSTKLVASDHPDIIVPAAEAAVNRHLGPGNEAISQLMANYVASNTKYVNLWGGSEYAQKLVEFVERKLGGDAPDKDVLLAASKKLINSLALGAQIPIHHTSAVLPSADPRVAALQSALNWLRSRGLGWGDLHPDNLMQRSDGQLVLIDFGSYDVTQYADLG